MQKKIKVRKSKVKPTIFDPNLNQTITLDSNEECEFYHWLLEGHSKGLVKTYNYHIRSYPLTPKQTYVHLQSLKTKSKEVIKTLFQPHEYTPDFIVEFTDKFFNTFDKTLLTSIPYVSKNPFVIDIKGQFARNGGAREFSINRKLMYHFHNIYVHKVIPEEFFKVTWLPNECKFTLKKKQVKTKYDSKEWKSIDEAISQIF